MSQQHPIVVTGATGPVGRRVVERLLAAGHPVRGTSRNPDRAALPRGAEPVHGDLGDPTTLATAFRGATQLVLIALPQTVREVLAQATKQGIEQVVLVSSAGVTAGYDTDYAAVLEEAVKDSGLEWSMVRPGEFAMNTLLMWSASIRMARRVVEAFPDKTSRPIHEADIAELVVTDLLDPRRRGRVDTILGPDPLTKREQVAAIAQAIGEDIAFEEVTTAQARAFYRAQGGFAAEQADYFFGDEDDATEALHRASIEDRDTYQSLDQITGAPARSYRQWARDHAADFR